MIKLIYLATPDIAVKALEKLNKKPDIGILAVVTQPDRPKGRGKKLAPPPVKVCASENNIECFQTEKISKDAELIKKLKELNPDFFVTFAFGQILSQEVLDIPRIATVNLHASLLPKYRGANPIQRCIYNGDTVTGITTMLTVLELDAGDICETEEIKISENMTDIELKDIIADKSPELIYSTLKGLYTGCLKPKEQCKDGITIANKFKKEDGLINWDNSAQNIHNQVRSMVDFPCAYTFFNGKMIKIIETEILNTENKNCSCGEIITVTKQGIEVNTKCGYLLIEKVKPESKGVMGAFDFANGAKISKKMKFGD